MIITPRIKHPSIRISIWLLSNIKGIKIADTSGLFRFRLEACDAIGVLYADPKDISPRKIRPFGIKRRMRHIKQDPIRYFIATIWFKTATDKDWEIEVFGRQHLKLMQKIAKKLEIAFNVKIDLQLTSERPRFEVSNPI